MLRSEIMDLLEITVNEDSVWEVFNCIATKQLAMLGGEKRDSIWDRGVLNVMKSCQETQEQIRYIIEKADEYQIQGYVTTNDPTATIKSIQQNQKNTKSSRSADQIFEDIRNDMNKRYGTLKALIENFDEQISIMETKKQELAILTNIEGMFRNHGLKGSGSVDGLQENERDEALDSENPGQSSKGVLSYFAGLLNTKDLNKFMRGVHRITKGNFFHSKARVEMDKVAQSDLNPNFYKSNSFVDAKTKKVVDKTLVFICVVNTGNSSMTQRVKLMFEIHEAYSISVDPGNQLQLMERRKLVMSELAE